MSLKIRFTITWLPNYFIVHIFDLILSKACKDAILPKNDDVIDLNFVNKSLPDAKKSTQSTNYDSGGHFASVDMSLASVFQKIHVFLMTWKLKLSCAPPKHHDFFFLIGQYHFWGNATGKAVCSTAPLFKKNVFSSNPLQTHTVVGIFLCKSNGTTSSKITLKN